MLAVNDAALAAKLADFKVAMARGVEEKSARLAERLRQDGLA
jgi:phosphoribosylcarboxyaminoimidazole (NCAIR) mutase